MYRSIIDKRAQPNKRTTMKKPGEEPVIRLGVPILVDSLMTAKLRGLVARCLSAGA